MNKFAKGVLITAAICLVLGISVCLVVGVTQGVGVLRDIRGWIFGRTNYQTEELSEQSFSGEITELEIEAFWGNVEIRTGTSFSVKGENLIEDTVSVKETNGILSVRQFWDKSFTPANASEQKIVITVPEEFYAEKIDMTFHAGNIKVNGLKTKSGTYTFGAGQVEMNDCLAESLVLHTGVGSVKISSCDFQNTTMESGVGEIDFSGILRGRCKLCLGIGEADIHIQGDPKDYYCDINAGIGGISFRSSSVSMDSNVVYANQNRTFGDYNAPNHMEITSGIGEAQIEITE